MDIYNYYAYYFVNKNNTIDEFLYKKSSSLHT
jgi:hypothetical protein